MVDSDERAETLANYLQEVQWVKEDVSILIGRAPLSDPLPVECGSIPKDEVVAVIKKIKSQKTWGS